MASTSQDQDAFSDIKDAFALMVYELETNEITQVDRTTTAGGINIADFKREIALKRFVNHKLPRGMTEFSTYAKGVFTQYKWNTKAISKLSRGVDNSETVLALVRKGDTDAADLVQQLGRLRPEKVYMKPHIDGLQERLRSAYTSHPELATTVWLPSIQSLAKARSVGKSADTAITSVLSGATAGIYSVITELAGSTGQTVEDVLADMDLSEDSKKALAPYLEATDADSDDDEVDLGSQVENLFAMLRQ